MQFPILESTYVGSSILLPWPRMKIASSGGMGSTDGIAIHLTHMTRGGSKGSGKGGKIAIYFHRTPHTGSCAVAIRSLLCS